MMLKLERGGEVSEEVQRVRVRRKPEEPTREEVEEHNVDHAQYREWCPHCVKGRGVSHVHRRVLRDDRGIPMVSMDYNVSGGSRGRRPRDADTDRQGRGVGDDLRESGAGEGGESIRGQQIEEGLVIAGT